MLMQALRGTQDILPKQVYKWNYIENMIRHLCALYGYGEIRTPMFEDTRLFLRGIGDTTDVVTKEMYTFSDRGGRSITLRPENTASVVRSFLEHKMYGDQQVQKVFYIGSMFRYDRPQAGRYREFHQFGVEILGAKSPIADAECIALAYDLFKRLGLNELKLYINSIGHSECRNTYRRKLIEFFEPKTEYLCDDCKERLHKNPLRILDCKEDCCKHASIGAPEITDYLCDDCHNKFEDVKKYLTSMGISYEVNPRLVRGLDYYTNTAFEIQYTPLGSQSAICGGGRYDGLVEEIGGPTTPGIGFAVGMERLLLALESQHLIPEPKETKHIYIAAIGKEAMNLGIRLQKELRDKEIRAEIDLQEKSLKGQMKYAGKTNASMTIIIGESELVDGIVQIKDMNTGIQQKINIAQASSYIEEHLDI
ncbi:MAG: histidine--tRNA ligase [Dialister pneumosintes]